MYYQVFQLFVFGRVAVSTCLDELRFHFSFCKNFHSLHMCIFIFLEVLFECQLDYFLSIFFYFIVFKLKIPNKIKCFLQKGVLHDTGSMSVKSVNINTYHVLGHNSNSTEKTTNK